jgi:sec-independent protein translocase protein TatA
MERLMFGMGLPEIMIILAAVLLVFGPSKLPQLGRSMGDAIGGFKKAMSGHDKQDSVTGREQA